MLLTGSAVAAQGTATRETLQNALRPGSGLDVVHISTHVFPTQTRGMVIYLASDHRPDMGTFLTVRAGEVRRDAVL